MKWESVKKKNAGLLLQRFYDTSGSGMVYSNLLPVVTTFKNPQEATQSPLGLPKVWVFQNYVDAFVNMQYPRALFNTVKITVLAVAIIVLVTSMAGYALARTSPDGETAFSCCSLQVWLFRSR